MKKFMRFAVLITAILTAAALAVGCGSDNQKLTAAFEPTFAPFESTDEKGEFVGFDIDLIKAIGEVQGFDVELRSMGFDGLVGAVQTEQIDVAISGMTIDEERKKKVNFSIPYYEAGLIMAVREGDNEITKPEDLKGKIIAVQIGTTGAKKANEFARQYGAEVKTFNSTDLVFMELINGNADVVINDKPVTEDFISKKGLGKVKMVGEPLTGEYYGIAVSKKNTELLNSINEGLEKLKENGKYEEIYRKWFKNDPPEFLPGEPK
ncbi:basic amino acid ABC transporter substrate-binding protein [Desulfolucanica intricata]|uniref:basic amino acid ABC transporter substrate-binding protein n=1 Tax=Desulfolucanica intricata TaxID=1285191 RepID=UPI000832CE75|nr:basic amino acid ABC transporter substrate-binding protein [Desulfolucanica intricata]